MYVIFSFRNRREHMRQVFKQDLTDTSDRPGGIIFSNMTIQ